MVASLLSTDTKTDGLPNPETPLHSIEELENHKDDSHPLEAIRKLAEYPTSAKDEPNQEMLILPVRGEFVAIRVDMVGKSEYQSIAVASLDRETLAVTVMGVP